jgi:DNA-binding NarL/FixJ family response regulator
MMSGIVLRIAVVEDHDVVRSGLTTILGREADFRIVASVGSGEALLDILDEVVPDVIVLDHRLPGINGAETCREVRRRRPSTSVLMLTSFPNDDVVRSCLGAGARGYFTKGEQIEQICEAIRSMARGSLVLGPAVADCVAEWARRVQTGPRSLDADDVQLLRLVAQGMSNRKIAEHLHLSDRLVKMRLKTTMRKLSSTSRSGAVASALERGLL